MNAQNVQMALLNIDKDGVPLNRRSTRYCLVGGNGHHYPPKLVWSRANHPELKAEDFSGGDYTNRRLGALGFKIIKCDCGGGDDPK
jgi:hypothetical protein